MNAIESTTLKIKAAGLVAILRGAHSVDEILRIGEALLEGTITVMEVTLNSPAALQALPLLRDRFGDRLLVGAGTVRSLDGARQALAAGAQFLVSPNFDPETVAFARTSDRLHLPGVFTATEVQAAFAAGCRMLKLFPMGDDGPAYLRALRGPFHDLDFVPTGGISLENIADFARAGAVAVGLGGNLVREPGQPSADLTAHARALRLAWEEGRHG